MRKQQLLTLIILVAFASTLPLVYAADALQKPNINVPSGWKLEDETAYPDAPFEHDQEGAGMLQYINPENGDEVKIYYERAQGSYTSPQLKDEAEYLFDRDLSEDGWAIDESGTKTVAGVNAGFAKSYDSEIDAYIEDIVFVKDGYYFNVLALYDANSASETTTYSLVNSLDAGGSILGGNMLFIIIGGVAAVIVVVVVVVVVVMRKKKQSQPQMAAAPQYTYPPPPPPT